MCNAWEVAGPVELGKAWAEELAKWEVDEPARMELFALSQRDEKSFLRANDVLMSLIKKRCDGEVVRNPSAFVHIGILNSKFGPNYQDERKAYKHRDNKQW